MQKITHFAYHSIQNIAPTEKKTLVVFLYFKFIYMYLMKNIVKNQKFRPLQKPRLICRTSNC